MPFVPLKVKILPFALFLCAAAVMAAPLALAQTPSPTTSPSPAATTTPSPTATTTPSPAATTTPSPAATTTPSPTATTTPSPGPTSSPTQTPDPAAAKVDAVKTAVADVNKLTAGANELRERAAALTVSLNEKCRLPSASDATLLEFQRISVEIGVAAQADIIKALTETHGKLKEAETKLKAAQAALPTAEPVRDDVKKAKADAQAALDETDARLKALDEAKTKLSAALLRGFTCAQGLVAAMSQKIAPLKALAADAKGDVALLTLNQSLPDLALVVALKERMWTIWGAKLPDGGLIHALAKLGVKNEAELKTVTDSMSTLDGDVLGVGKNLKTWLAAVAAFGKTKRSKLGEVVQQVVVDPAMFSGQGLSEVKAGSRLGDDLRKLSDALAAMEARLRDVLPAPELQAFSDAGTEVVEETRRLGVAVTMLQETIGGNFENFQADQVSLFYFTDVPRLMQALNSSTFEVGGAADARARAEQARRELAEAELTLAEAQGQVNAHQRRLRDLTEEQRQSRAQLLSAEGLLTIATRRLEELKARPDKEARRVTAAEQRLADLQAERDAAKERDDALSSEEAGLPAKIREARGDLLKAQERVREGRASIIRFALVESEAFARARDNTPFLVAMPMAASTDPARRVMLYAFGDSKTIFMRGKPEDLDKVRDIIARFDRPAPQARMTLWSLELNSTADKDGSRRFNEALQTIEAELSNTRARITTSLSFLRDCINQEVNRVARLRLEKERTPQNTQALDPAFLRWARLHFYQREVLMRLGFRPDAPYVSRQRLGVTHFTLPDPVATTTLGEALMVLSLANPESQKIVAEKFKEGLKGQINDLRLAGGEDRCPPGGLSGDDRNDPYRLCNKDARFVFMRRAMGLGRQYGGLEDTNHAQLEIVRAIQAGALSRVIDQQRRQVRELERIDKALSTATGDDLRALRTARENVVEELQEIEGWLSSEFGVRRQTTESKPATPAGGQGAVAGQTAGQTAPKVAGGQQDSQPVTYSAALASVNAETARAVERELNPLRTATARVAAADQMLKEMIIAVEDDLDRHFVQPMMVRLRDGLVRHYKGVGVGLIQRTSVLATNRGLARVDARGSAQLALGQETDIIEGVQQLANLYLAGQTGNVLSILGGLNALPRRDASELYGLTTGGVFKVTPIFDPSGQALRFQFDHVSATMVREPDGTVNPQLPRVERHTINTEVQLSNMELREVSRFNANARLGLPTRTAGGLPLLNSVPWIRRNVPLLGWFVKKGGSAPFVQQSLVFGQTTMYPTIGDLMDLLRNPESRDGRP